MNFKEAQGIRLHASTKRKEAWSVCVIRRHLMVWGCSSRMLGHLWLIPFPHTHTSGKLLKHFRTIFPENLPVNVFSSHISLVCRTAEEWSLGRWEKMLKGYFSCHSITVRRDLRWQLKQSLTLWEKFCQGNKMLVGRDKFGASSLNSQQDLPYFQKAP